MIDFNVRILGSGSALPKEGRMPTSQLVECRGTKILIDCGEGTQLQFRKFGIRYQGIEHILISHLHGDHYFGLVGLLSSMHLLGRTKAINVYGAKELKEIINLQLQYAGSRLSFPIIFHEIKKEGVAFETEKLTVKYFPLNHKIPTTGFLIEEKQKKRPLLIEKVKKDQIKIAYYHRLKKGEDILTEEGKWIKYSDYTSEAPKIRRYAFCSDTKYDKSIVPYITGVDLLYHEATFTEDKKDRAQKTFHSTARQAADIAKLAGVDRLVLGHISARYENGDKHLIEAKEVFQNVIVATDGMSFEL